MSSTQIRGGIRQTEPTIVLRDGASDQTTVQVGSPGSAVTFTLPDTSSVLVGRDTTDTGANRLQNKELSADTVLLVDGTDITKKFQLDVSNLTTSSTRVLTLADGDMIVGGDSNDNDLLTRIGSQALSNKTITDASNNISATQLTSGTVPDARISQSSVTQHVGAIDHDLLLNYDAYQHIDWRSATEDFQTSGTLSSGAATLDSLDIDADNDLTVNSGRTAGEAEGGGLRIDLSGGLYGAINYEDALQSHWKIGKTGETLYEVVTTGHAQTIDDKTLTNVTSITMDPNTSIDVTSAGVLDIGATATDINIGQSGQTTTIVGNLHVAGTSTTVNSATLDVADANITVNDGGDKTTAVGAGLTVDSSGDGAPWTTAPSLSYNDTLVSGWELTKGNGTATEIVTVAGTQTLDAKTLTDVGSITIGTSPGFVNSPLKAENTFSGTASSVVIGTYVEQNRTGASASGGTYGIAGEVDVDISGGTTGEIAGLSGHAQVNVGTTASSAYGVTGLITEDGSGTITKGASIRAEVPAGTGYTNSYALLTEREVGFGQTATPDNPGSGYNKLYFKNDDKLYQLDSAGFEEEVGSGGSGIGEVNFCTNPNAKVAVDLNDPTDIGDWIGSGNLAASRITTPELRIPRFPFQEQSIGIQSTDTVASGDVRLRFRVSAADRNKKLKVEWAQNTAGYTTGFLVLEMYSYSDSAFSADERQYTFSGSTDIPEQTGVYYNEFDADDREYYEMRIVYDTALFATSGIFLNDVVIGPGKLHSGGVVTAWESFTPTSNLTGSGTATGFRRRVGDTWEAQMSFTNYDWDSTGSISIDMESGLTADASKITLAARQSVGTAMAFDQSATGYYSGGVYIGTAANTLSIFGDSAGGSIWNGSGSNPHNWLDGSDVLTVKVSVPVEEWQGSGVLNTIVQDNLTNWTSFTPVWSRASGTATPDATPAVDKWYYRRVGNSMEITAAFRQNSAGADTGSGGYTVAIPEGLTVDATVHNAGGISNASDVGVCQLSDSSTNSHGTVMLSSATELAFFGGNATTGETTIGNHGSNFRLTNTLFGLAFTATVAIDEWKNDSQSSLVGFTKASQGTLGLTTTTGTGMVPLGTILPIASHLAGHYPIPGSGTVSAEGWMYCDGSAVPGGNSISGSVPNLTDGRYLRGSTSAGGTFTATGATAGSRGTNTASGTTGDTGVTISWTSGASSNVNCSFTNPTIPNHQHIFDTANSFARFNAGNTGYVVHEDSSTPSWTGNIVSVATGWTTTTGTFSGQSDGTFVQGQTTTGGGGGSTSGGAASFNKSSLNTNQTGSTHSHPLTSSAFEIEPSYLQVQYVIRVD